MREPPSNPESVTRDRHLLGWLAGAAVLIVASAFAASQSHRFSYDYEVIEMPALALAAGLCSAGLVFALLVPLLIRRSVDGRPMPCDAGRRPALLIVIVAGFVARLVLLPSEPMLEDDYQRYLWDGGVTASGLNPFAASPRSAAAADPSTPLGRLAQGSGTIVERIGHAGLKTIYPPVAQAAFALAHGLSPWNLTSWKWVLLGCDAALLALLLVLLAEAGRPLLWCALYWWNPLVLKEVFNSAHMEPVVMVPVMAALLLVVRRRPVVATAMLGIAAGAKVWPLLLVPLAVRPLLTEPKRLLLALGLLAALMALWAWPVIAGGLDNTSGFVAYAEQWRTNSALLPALESAIRLLTSPFAGPEAAGRLARALLAVTAVAVAVGMAIAPLDGPLSIIRRAGAVCAALVLLSPSQYPWYAIWFLPFLPFLTLRSFLALTALLPVYYVFFHFNARSQPDIFRVWVVWLIWLPAWAALWIDVSEKIREATFAGSVRASR